MQLRYYQQAAIDAIYAHLRNRDDNPVAVLPTGCHESGHPILMHDGSVKAVEDVRVGDQLMGPDSQPRTVLNLCRGRDEMYRVTPRRGEPFTVNGDHVLHLECTNEGKSHPCNKSGGEVDHVTVREYLDKKPWWKHLRKLKQQAVNFPQRQDSLFGAKPLPIAPYILGLLLGDGSLDSMCLHTADDEVADAFCGYVEFVGGWVKQVDCGNGLRELHPRKYSNNKHGLLGPALDELQLRNATGTAKFIPQPYLTASREDRLQLLAGLIDTDGSNSKNCFDFVNKSERLSRGVVFIARSLGLRANIKACIKRSQHGTAGQYWRVNISGDTHEVPCRIPRKQCEQRSQKKSPDRFGFTVEPVGPDEFYGFTLDGDHLYLDGNFIIHHNSGKTPLLATICSDAVQRWGGRVLVLAHVKELLEQAHDKLQAICPDIKVGLYSAGLKSRQTDEPVIVAGIQSVYRRAEDLGRFDLILIDEAHLIPLDGDGMYRQFLADMQVINPRVRCVGLTATPYRLKDGLIASPDHFLNHICYEVGVRELIHEGFLCPLKSKGGISKADLSGVHVRGGEWQADELEDAFNDDAVVMEACREIAGLCSSRRSVLIFTCGVAHGQNVAYTLNRITGEECGFLCGETSDAERAELLSRFKGGDLRWLVNVNVLTTGFDAPNVDAVVLLRSTLSPGLYYQMVGRGFRLSPGKSDCAVLDFGDNIVRHGPVDDIRIDATKGGKSKGEAPAKECPNCHEVIAAGYSNCPECGCEFPEANSPKHHQQASGDGVLSDQFEDEVLAVHDVTYAEHTKRGADEDAPKTLRVDYLTGLGDRVSEWVCIEHTGWPRQKAEAWWDQRTITPCPTTAAEAVQWSSGLATPDEITVRRWAGKKWPEIVSVKITEPLSQLDELTALDEELPF